MLRTDDSERWPSIRKGHGSAVFEPILKSKAGRAFVFVSVTCILLLGKSSCPVFSNAELKWTG
uniref:Uncharacterized protein n=1 Tax=Coccidioides posadasii RMSCC 3488 TaxID=454284 RepID=A0A0J6FCW6_COCPO|nr:hypothetical protein CPAG_07230 [Coccidioides posadasii RMSCC 3488]